MLTGTERRSMPVKVLDIVSHVVVGKTETGRLVIAALLAGGHVLIEGLPGTAKTLLGKVFAQAIGGEFKRVQLTPDLLPADVTGFYLYTPDGVSRLIRGPIFANVVLADELNRATPRTQAAFLEAMQENQVTIEGQRYLLPAPFMVIATQQAAGSEGTYALTNVQVDRFMFRVWSGYPDPGEEVEVLSRIDALEAPAVPAATTPEDVMTVREMVRKVHVAPEIRSYIVALVQNLRHAPGAAVGPGPRASISLYKGARALAFLEGREFVLPDDVKQLAHPVLDHRVRITEEMEIDGETSASLVDKVLAATEVPKFR